MTNKLKASQKKPREEAGNGDNGGEIEQALQAFRSATGLEVCVKLLNSRRAGTGLDAVAKKYSLHNTAFCRGVKRTRNEQCRACDLQVVPERCQRERVIFSHVCHAGAGETIIPLFVDETLAAVVYVGQYRTSDDQPARLPQLTAGKLKEVEGLCRLLSAYLGERLRAPRFVSESSRGFRSEVIQRFLEKNLRGNLTLGDLAKHLGLSTTRTAHVVREAMGSSFVKLRDELRMARARDLLQGTYHKVAYVAAECGFASPQYFHRFFRRQAKMTPLAFRKQRRAEV